MHRTPSFQDFIALHRAIDEQALRIYYLQEARYLSDVNRGVANQVLRIMSGALQEVQHCTGYMGFQGGHLDGQAHVGSQTGHANGHAGHASGQGQMVGQAGLIGGLGGLGGQGGGESEQNGGN